MGYVWIYICPFWLFTPHPPTPINVEASSPRALRSSVDVSNQTSTCHPHHPQTVFYNDRWGWREDTICTTMLHDTSLQCWHLYPDRCLGQRWRSSFREHQTESPLQRQMRSSVIIFLIHLSNREFSTQTKQVFSELLFVMCSQGCVFECVVFVWKRLCPSVQPCGYSFMSVRPTRFQLLNFQRGNPALHSSTWFCSLASSLWTSTSHFSVCPFLVIWIL